MLSSESYTHVVKEEGIKWLHMYMFQEKELVANSIRLAEATGNFTAIVLTCDHPHIRVQNRMVPDFAALTPAVKKGSAGYNRPFFPNQAAAGGTTLTVGELQSGKDMRSGSNSYTLSWQDVQWVLSLTKLPIVCKGILSPQDAEMAISAGASAIVVSNHGGRQFDGAPPAIEVLPAILAVVAGRIPVFIDSGIRTSTDILKCLCLGATGVLLGRPALWALSCGGAPSLRRMLDHLQSDLADDMRSLGVKSLKEVNASFLYKDNLTK